MDDLISSKRAVGRDVDLEDVRLLGLPDNQGTTEPEEVGQMARYARWPVCPLSPVAGFPIAHLNRLNQLDRSLCL